jgi:hypothetical protein
MAMPDLDASCGFGSSLIFVALLHEQILQSNEICRKVENMSLDTLRIAGSWSAERHKQTFSYMPQEAKETCMPTF